VVNVSVFVYGTLKSDKGAARLMYQAGGAPVTKHTTDPVFKFYDLGGFPGAQLGGTIAIQGELWSVPMEGIERVLDRYEGYSPEYPEESLFVRHMHKEADGTEFSMYIYNGGMGNTAQNTTGIWPMKKE
jgi:gamma-glutamylcyclotransferase (GGCT)/AIG2-like uncharacterized protein YtfP